jgi:hypothetical protein
MNDCAKIPMEPHNTVAAEHDVMLVDYYKTFPEQKQDSEKRLAQ